MAQRLSRYGAFKTPWMLSRLASFTGITTERYGKRQITPQGVRHLHAYSAIGVNEGASGESARMVIRRPSP